MRALIWVVLFMCGSLYAGGQYYSSRPNFYGGYNYYQSGRYLGQSRSNFYGGHDYYNNSGRFYMRSTPSYYNRGYQYRSYGRGPGVGGF